MHDKATLLMKEFIDMKDDYSEIESFIYNLTSTIEGLPSDLRSMGAVNSEFVTPEFVTVCLEKARTHAKTSDGDALTELSEYVSEFKS